MLASLHRPALILMDLAMPEMDGFAATRHLRTMLELGQVVIMALSASISDAAQDKSTRAGCNDFLLKPVQAGALLDKMQQWLALEWIRREESPLPPSTLVEAEAARMPQEFFNASAIEQQY